MRSENSRGRVVRTAARAFRKAGGSVPSSQRYTTRKDSTPLIKVEETGVSGDYNHYRTKALKSTPDRAVSILTGDVGSLIRTIDGGYYSSRYRDGDLGENVLVEGVDHRYFEIGRSYRFTSRTGEEKVTAGPGDVIVEITEPMEPCANLCKLPYINDPAVSSPKEKIARCRFFIEALGRTDGLRGWYARVKHGGTIGVGDSVTAIA